MIPQSCRQKNHSFLKWSTTYCLSTSVWGKFLLRKVPQVEGLACGFGRLDRTLCESCWAGSPSPSTSHGMCALTQRRATARDGLHLVVNGWPRTPGVVLPVNWPGRRDVYSALNQGLSSFTKMLLLVDRGLSHNTSIGKKGRECFSLALP